VLAELLKPPAPQDAGMAPVEAPAPALVKPPPARPLLGLLAAAVCVSAGMWLRTTDLVAVEVGYIVGVPLVLYGVVRGILGLVAFAQSVYAGRI
jgi:hypothetical protein